MELKDNDRLAEAYRQGDREVLGQLYRAWRDDVEAMLRGGFTFTSDGRTVRFQGYDEPFRLQEALQDAFIHAFKERVRQNYDPSRSFRPYLMTVIRNHLIDKFRRRQLESELFVAAEDVAAEDESGTAAMDRLGQQSASNTQDASPETEAMREEVGQALQSFVEELDEIDAEILRHYLLGEMTQHEMADHLDTDRNTVRKHIRMIRRSLLGHLKRRDLIGTSDVESLLDTLSQIGVVT
jgi:RNA polymerase sigma factor (sigma-70 family)